MKENHKIKVTSIMYMIVLMLMAVGIKGAFAENAIINGTYSLIVTQSGKALDTSQWGTIDGTNITLNDYWGGESQKFIITPVDGIWHRITPVIAPDQAFDVSKCSPNVGANIQTWSYEGGACQQFRFAETGNGTYQIITRGTDMSLNVNNLSEENDTNVMQSTSTGKENQIFTLRRHAESHISGNCPDGAICRDEEAPGLYDGKGPYNVRSYELPGAYVTLPATARVYYPANAEPPYSGIVFCPPFMTKQIAFAAWGPWFASHGMVLVTMDTTTIFDQVTARDNQQWRVVKALREENTRLGSPLRGKLDTDKIGIMGWSMGGGASWINAGKHRDELKTVISLAGHNMTAWFNTDIYSWYSPKELLDAAYASGRLIKIPALIINGALDTTILGGLGQSDGVYRSISNTPKVLAVLGLAGHFAWGYPTQSGRGVAALVLAFEKTFLDGDTRWAPYIQKPSAPMRKWRTSDLP
ncbi:RICIN domain-containing protein [Vibrio spartinae]|uniref:Lipase 1 n=1 Tax=Vibrio spartinae TaxID=1918945 RepID=A0ABX6QXC3_9VIBR|nr:RICIN domain-containing protein [Vibrio spartinae]QMV13854.1 Lipase 1 [Vibrio spartinae]